jgi:hypothetical protein
MQERWVPVKVERDVFAESGAIGLQIEPPKNVALSSPWDSFVRAVYLAAIVVATIGWIWLIVWIAMRLI